MRRRLFGLQLAVMLVLAICFFGPEQLAMAAFAELQRFASA